MKRRPAKKTGPTILIVILLVLLLLVALIYAPVWDTAPPDVTDLAIARTEVPLEQNAYTYFLQATNALRNHPDFSLSQYLLGQTNDEAQVSAFIATNREVVAWIRRGVACGECQAPAFEGGPEGILNHPVHAFIDKGRLLATQARYDQLRGDMREAVDATLLLLGFGDRLVSASESIIEYLCSHAVLGLGLERAADLASDARCDATERGRLAAALAELSFLRQGMANSARGEYVFSMKLLEQTRSGGTYLSYAGYWGVSKFKRAVLLIATRIACTPNYFIQYNRTMRMMAENYRLLAAYASCAYADHPLRASATSAAISGDSSTAEGLLAKRIQPHRSRLPLANALGERLWSATAGTLDAVVRNGCRQECHLAATRLILACRAYEEAAGHLPATLEALVPDYLPAVPRDPFDGQPFRYSAEKRIVYSVGENLTDDGGDEGRERGRRRAKDLVFKLFTHEPETTAE